MTTHYRRRHASLLRLRFAKVRGNVTSVTQLHTHLSLLLLSLNSSYTVAGFGFSWQFALALETGFKNATRSQPTTRVPRFSASPLPLFYATFTQLFELYFGCRWGQFVSSMRAELAGPRGARVAQHGRSAPRATAAALLRHQRAQAAAIGTPPADTWVGSFWMTLDDVEPVYVHKSYI
jgi:hypothetical protein